MPVFFVLKKFSMAQTHFQVFQVVSIADFFASKVKVVQNDLKKGSI